MPPASADNHSEILRLLKENNELLKKQERRAVLSTWLKVIWLVTFIGLPIIAYYTFRSEIEGLMSVTAPLHGAGNFDMNAVFELYGFTPEENPPKDNVE